MISHAKSLPDDDLFHLLLRCLLGSVVSMAAGNCKMTICQTVTEFIIPDLWKVTKLLGNYDVPEVSCVVCNSKYTLYF